MKKIFLFFSILILLLLFCSSNLSAQEAIKTSASVVYEIDDNLITKVTHNITLQNTKDTLFAKDYTLNLGGLVPKNVKVYDEHGKNLEFFEYENDFQQVEIKIIFPNALIGKGKVRNFSINFEENSIVRKNGQIWELSIPGVSRGKSFDSYIITLIIPSEFSETLYFNPEPSQTVDSNGKKFFHFNNIDVLGNGIKAFFGEFQLYSFDITYHLDNPYNRRNLMEIAIPPDSPYQRVYYESISPAPENVLKDEEGNWIAYFSLASKQRIDVKIQGVVQIFAKKQLDIPFSDSYLSQTLKESKFWQINDEKIQKIAKELESPKEIYEFVRTALTYNFEGAYPYSQRLGAVEALKNPKSATCTEFTDLFIALARAKGIPAREVNGYAYTDNPKIQPLSLVEDVLHAWPEYWDFEKRVWIPVDPTWGSTTGGFDFFSKFDLRHFSFVFHGINPEKPYPPGLYKLATNPQKDVFISFTKKLTNEDSTPLLTTAVDLELPFLKPKLIISIQNPGPLALYSKNIQVSQNETAKTYFIESLPPFGNTQITHYFGNLTQDLVVNLDDIKVINNAVSRTGVIIKIVLYVFCLFIFILFTVFVLLNKKNILRIKNVKD